jgi:hypothetical protein
MDVVFCQRATSAACAFLVKLTADSPASEWRVIRPRSGNTKLLIAGNGREIAPLFGSHIGYAPSYDAIDGEPTPKPEFD